FGAAVWTARIVWEETALSWREGPQMIGFSFSHTGGALFGLSWAGAHVLIAVVLIRILWSKPGESRRRRRLAVPGLGVFPVVVPLWIPMGVYLRLSFGWWGPGSHSVDHFVCAAGRGDLGLVNYLLSTGIPVDAEDGTGTTALNVAVTGGKMPVVEFLLRNGADPNHRTGNLRRTPLMNAAERNRDDSIQA